MNPPYSTEKKAYYPEESKDAPMMETSLSNSTLSTGGLSDEQKKHLNPMPGSYDERP